MEDFVVSYRTYEYDNRTPEFTLTQRVSYDNNAVEPVAAVHTEPFSVQPRDLGRRLPRDAGAGTQPASASRATTKTAPIASSSRPTDNGSG